MKRAKAEKAEYGHNKKDCPYCAIDAEKYKHVLGGEERCPVCNPSLKARKQGKSSSAVMNLYLAIEQQESDGTYLRTLLARGFDLDEDMIHGFIESVKIVIESWEEEASE